MVALQTESIFIDCFNQGVLRTPKNCATFLQVHSIEFETRYLEPTPHHHIVARMLRNLIAIYQKRDESKQAGRFQRLLSIIESMEAASSQD
jgi:regulator of sirC expression with transglutaminase-like and TPR domain